MRTAWILFIAASKMFLRNKQVFIFTLFMPAIIMSIFGFIGFDQVPKVEMGIVIDKPNKPTQEFVDQLKKIDAFNISQGDLNSEKDSLQKGDRALVVQIPNELIFDYEAWQNEQIKNLPQQQAYSAAAANTITQMPPPNINKQTVNIFTNISQAQYAQSGIIAISQMLDKINLKMSQAPELFEIKTETINAKNVKYLDFLLPGIICMSVMQMAVFSVAFLFASYREKGVLKRLLATPMKPWQFVTANVLTRLIVSLIQTGILVALGVYLLKANVVGSYWLILLISILGSIMFLGLGFVISGLSKTVETVPVIANIVVFPMLFLSGIFFPTSGMPDWMQNIVQYLPLTYFAHAMREVMANGVSLKAIATDLYWMTGWSILLVILANFTFSFADKKN